MKNSRPLLFLLIPLIFASCHKIKRPLPLGDVKGIHYTEVRRAFTNGLHFNKKGYQLAPLWKCYFISDDSVMVFSPTTKKYYGFHVYFDHDSIFNMVGTWLVNKKITKDSLVFQSLKVENKVILDDYEGSKVVVTFYSDDYRKRKGAEYIRKLSLPDKKDTLFIKNLINLGITHPDSVFAATDPVAFKSNSPLLKVEKVKNVSTPLEKIDAAIDYLSPEYNITIYKAYEDFDYSFYVYVNDKGEMQFRKSAIYAMPEYKVTYDNVMRGIVNGYLTHYLEITPGNTLGIPHTTSILLNVTGYKSAPPIN